MPFTDRNLEDIRRDVAQFANERDWDQFHSPRNLLLALVGEVGEAAEIVRWQGDGDPERDAMIPAELDMLKPELAEARLRAVLAGERVPDLGFRSSAPV